MDYSKIEQEFGQTIFSVKNFLISWLPKIYMSEYSLSKEALFLFSLEQNQKSVCSSKYHSLIIILALTIFLTNLNWCSDIVIHLIGLKMFCVIVTFFNQKWNVWRVILHLFSQQSWKGYHMWWIEKNPFFHKLLPRIW